MSSKAAVVCIVKVELQHPDASVLANEGHLGQFDHQLRRVRLAASSPGSDNSELVMLSLQVRHLLAVPH